MTKYQLVHVNKYDEFIMEEFDGESTRADKMVEVVTNPQKVVDDSYNYMCLSDRKQTLVELRKLIDEFNYDVIASVSYEDERKKMFIYEEEESND